MGGTTNKSTCAISDAFHWRGGAHLWRAVRCGGGRVAIGGALTRWSFHTFGPRDASYSLVVLTGSAAAVRVFKYIKRIAPPGMRYALYHIDYCVYPGTTVGDALASTSESRPWRLSSGPLEGRGQRGATHPHRRLLHPSVHESFREGNHVAAGHASRLARGSMVPKRFMDNTPVK